jgi:hypothetical protein
MTLLLLLRKLKSYLLKITNQENHKSKKKESQIKKELYFILNIIFLVYILKRC